MSTIPAPVVEVVDHAVGGLEHFASVPTAHGGGIEVDLYRTGTIIEAQVTRYHDDGRPSERLLTERLNIRPCLDAWLKDLLDRAGKGAS